MRLFLDCSVLYGWGLSKIAIRLENNGLSSECEQKNYISIKRPKSRELSGYTPSFYPSCCPSPGP